MARIHFPHKIAIKLFSCSKTFELRTSKVKVKQIKDVYPREVKPDASS